MLLPEPLQNVVNALARLPGIGPKSASRLAFYLLRAPDNVAQELADALQGMKSQLANCPQCFNITMVGRERCEICEHPQRDPAVICVVEDSLDVLALERNGGFTGHYHVLHGLLSPIDGTEPKDLKIAELFKRIQGGGVREIILATNPSMEGDATAMYLQRQIEPLGIQVTRLARGLPVGGDLEYADQNTLLRALAGRQRMD